jgi:hypothetical protein
MRSVTLPLPQFGFIVATRAALGAGIGLLAASRLPARRRRTVGLALIAVGAAATVPAVRWLARGLQAMPPGVERDPRLIGATRYPRRGGVL